MDLLNKLINYSGLQKVTLWAKETFVQKETGKGLSTKDYTQAHYDKVAAIPEKPKYTDTIPDLTPYLKSTDATATLASLGGDGKVIPSQLPVDKDTVTTINGKTGAITKEDIVALGIPAQDTNTTYAAATTTEDGLMQSTQVIKLRDIAEGAEVNVIAQVKRNGTILNPVNKAIDIDVPVSTSQLTNDSGYLTNTQVQQIISDARYMKKEIVETLPATGADNTLYLVGAGGTGTNLYEEHMYINDKWELIGSTETEIDLSGYVKSVDIQIATTEEIQTLLNS